MTTTTPAEIREKIDRALRDRAIGIRHEAALRGNSGEHNAAYRASLRAEAQLCEDLAHVVAHTDPQRLAQALDTGKPDQIPAWLAYAGVPLDQIPDDGQRAAVRAHRAIAADSGPS
jgi:hypothetical protein